MRKLKIPLEDVSVKEIFLDCIQNLDDKDVLKKCANLIQKDSDVYRQRAPLQLTGFYYQKEFPDGVTGERLKDVYSNTFVSRKKFYNKILFPKDLTECPICDTGELSTLDHYLPKSVVPTLAVTPCNLVPMCDKCNRIKLDRMETEPGRMPFHMYFDDFSKEPWLAVRLVPGEELAAVYEIQYTGGDTVQQERMQRHLELYKLKERFRDKASGEMARNRRTWCRKLARSGEVGLRLDIEDKRISEEEMDMNSWRSALYRALEAHVDVLIQWLTAEEPANTAPVEAG